MQKKKKKAWFLCHIFLEICFGVCLSTLKFYLSAMGWSTVQGPSTLHTHVLASWQHYGNFSDN